MRPPCDACKTKDSSELLIKAKPSNENKISHRWRGRAWIAMEVLKSCESYASERPAVGWSDWLGLFVSIYNEVRSSPHFVQWWGADVMVLML